MQMFMNADHLIYLIWHSQVLDGVASDFSLRHAPKSVTILQQTIRFIQLHHGIVSLLFNMALIKDYNLSVPWMCK